MRKVVVDTVVIGFDSEGISVSQARYGDGGTGTSKNGLVKG